MRGLAFWALLAATLLLQACSDDSDADREACLSRPDLGLKAPSGALPCELLPPGLQLKK
jgi:hypothetical protein